MQSYVLLMEGARADIRQLSERPPHIPHKYVEWYPLVREQGAAWEGVDGDRYVIREPAPEAIVPDLISPRQARLALLAIGKLNAANAAVEAAGDVMKVSWEFSSYIRRNDPGVISLARAIGLDEEAMDNLFIEAAKL